MRALLCLGFLVACGEEISGTTPITAPTPTPTPTGTPPQADANVWYIDDEEHPGLYTSLNCQMSGDQLILNGADSGGVGTLQILMGERPLADATLVVNPSGAVAAGEVYLSIGRDRESENQYVAQSGEVDVQVIDTPPRAILVTFTDLPAETTGGEAALLSGDVGAREGKFIGACDFDDL